MSEYDKITENAIKECRERINPLIENIPNSGIYKIKWKKKSGGGYSVGSIYQDCSGVLWIAPVNWVKPGKLNDHIKSIKKLIKIEAD